MRERIHVSLPKEQKKIILDEAKKDKVTVSKFIRNRLFKVKGKKVSLRIR